MNKFVSTTYNPKIMEDPIIKNILDKTTKTSDIKQIKFPFGSPFEVTQSYMIINEVSIANLLREIKNTTRQLSDK